MRFEHQRKKREHGETKGKGIRNSQEASCARGMVKKGQTGKKHEILTREKPQTKGGKGKKERSKRSPQSGEKGKHLIQIGVKGQGGTRRPYLKSK